MYHLQQEVSAGCDDHPGLCLRRFQGCGLGSGEGYDSYQWSTEETTQTIEVNSSGSYSVEVVNNSSESVENNYSMNFDGIDDFLNVGLCLFI